MLATAAAWAVLSCVPLPAAGVHLEGLEEAGLPGRVLASALGYLHTRYLYGGTDGSGMDCSGLVYRSFLEGAGLALPRQTGGQYLSGREVRTGLLPADLLFFDTEGQGPSHVGIYLGAGRFVHAASEGPATGVIVSSLAEPYYAERLLEGRRVLPFARPVIHVSLGGGPAGPAAELVNLQPTLPAGVPVQLVLEGGGRPDGFATVELSRNGAPVLSRRVRLEGQARLWFTPTEGSWEVRVLAPRDELILEADSRWMLR